ncbi:helix-turn-helix domain-containing protein, partial [Enterococcus hirae]
VFFFSFIIICIIYFCFIPVYKSIVEDLENGVAISKIAKDYNVTRQTVYRIKNDL